MIHTFLATYNLHHFNKVTNNKSILLDLIIISNKNDVSVSQDSASLVPENVYHPALHISFANQKDPSVVKINIDWSFQYDFTDVDS